MKDMIHPTGEAGFRLAYQQGHPQEICGDVSTPLVTSELFAANDFYGQASAIKRYAGVPQNRSLKFVLEHGIRLADNVWQHEMEAPLGVILSCTPWRAAIHRQNSNKLAIPAGFGYLYAIDVARDETGPDPAAEQRLGTLAFPCHSTHMITPRFDHHDYAEKLSALPAEFQPVSVCGYWKDILDGNLAAYPNRGLSIFSCGHMYDRNFMVRFHDLCRNFRYTVSNKIGTHLFQSVASGCSFFFLESSPIDYEIPASERKNCSQFRPLFKAAEAKAQALFAEPVSKVTHEQREFVDYYLGTPHQLSRAEMQRMIRKTNWLDVTMPRMTRTAVGLKIHAPSAWSRSVRFPLRRLRNLKRSVRKRLSKHKSTA